MEESDFASGPVSLYAADLLMCAVAYTALSIVLSRAHGPGSGFAERRRAQGKEWGSLALYLAALALAVLALRVALALIALVAAIWLVPDRRFERGRKGAMRA